jgi:capsular polysaccharide transport system permease protein
VNSRQPEAALNIRTAPEPTDPAAAPPAEMVEDHPPAAAATMRPRHFGLLASLIFMAVVPALLTGIYLWGWAADRYVSRVAFSVRQVDAASASDLLGGLARLAGTSSSSDTDILYQFIQSQELVGIIDGELDLRRMWSNGDPALDPWFSYHPPGTIEDLTSYWPRMVKVYNDSGTGIVNVEVQAFTPDDAHAIATRVYEESARLVNELSAVAREDTLRYSREDRDEAVARLKEAREAMTGFRNRTQIVDPAASVQNQMGLLLSLQTQLAETLIARATLKDTAPADDPRILQADRRIEVIRQQIEEERKNLGLGSNAAGDTGAFADLVGEYERLAVDLQFAEQSYTAAMAAYDAAVAESRRQTRYLAAHVAPTRPEASEQPRRLMLLALVWFFSFLAWGVVVLVYYSLRDRR